MQTGSCGVFLSAGSSSESGRGGRVDGKKRELEEEEAVGEDLFEFSYLFSGCPQERLGETGCVAWLPRVLPHVGNNLHVLKFFGGQ